MPAPDVTYTRHPDGQVVRTETIVHLTADGVGLETHVESRWISRRAMWTAIVNQLFGGTR